MTRTGQCVEDKFNAGFNTASDFLFECLLPVFIFQLLFIVVQLKIYQASI